LADGRRNHRTVQKFARATGISCGSRLFVERDDVRIWRGIHALVAGFELPVGPRFNPDFIRSLGRDRIRFGFDPVRVRWVALIENDGTWNHGLGGRHRLIDELLENARERSGLIGAQFTNAYRCGGYHGSGSPSEQGSERIA